MIARTADKGYRPCCIHSSARNRITCFVVLLVLMGGKKSVPYSDDLC